MREHIREKDGIIQKKCNCCKRWLTKEGNFYNKHGQCKKCMIQYQSVYKRAWRAQQTPEFLREYDKANNDNLKDYRHVYYQRRYQEERDLYLKRQSAYDKETNYAAQRRYYARNREAILNKMREAAAAKRARKCQK